MILTKAYGKILNSQKTVLEAFNNEKDFIIEDFNHPHSGRPVNRQQLDKGQLIEFRYGNNKSKCFCYRIK